MTILCFDTSTKSCSIGLFDHKHLVDAVDILDEKYVHSEKLHTEIEGLLKKNAKDISDLDAVAIGKGPGSYTGLRIGVSAAKGICFALNIPLVAIDSLKILAHSQKASMRQGELILPMFDARRDEVFLQLFDKNFNSVWPTRSQILDESFYSELKAIDKPIIICGDASIKAEELLGNFGPLDQLEFKHNEHPLASYMGEITQRYLQQNKVEDLAYFEPFYGKDFQAIPSKK